MLEKTAEKAIEVHSGELELLQQAVDTYDWKAIEIEVENIRKTYASMFPSHPYQTLIPQVVYPNRHTMHTPDRVTILS